MFQGHKLKQLRTNAKLSINGLERELYKKMDISISPQTIAYWERKASNPSSKSINALAKFFNVPMDFFYT